MKAVSYGSAVLLTLIFAVAFLGCDDNGPNIPYVPPNDLHIVELDTIWALHSERMQRIAIRMSAANEYTDRDMICIITYPSGSNTHFRMYDDGNFGVWNDALGYADTLSGDSAPGDGIYSRRISAKFAPSAGQYRLTFALSDSPPPDSVIAIVTVRESFPPAIVSFTHPDSIRSGQAGGQFTLEVGDPEGYGDIYDAELIIYRTVPASNNFVPILMQHPVDSLWSYSSEPNISVGLPTGNYPVVARVRDYYLKQSNDWVYSDTTGIWLENKPPHVSSLEGLDTVFVPGLGNDDTIYFNFNISVADDQGVTDLDTLFLSLRKDDIEIWQHGYIDGLELDTVALDGIFVAGFSANAGNSVDVNYTFRWTPSDRTGQRGGYFENTVYFQRDSNNWAAPQDNNENGESIISDRNYRPSPFKSDIHNSVKREQKN